MGATDLSIAAWSAGAVGIGTGAALAWAYLKSLWLCVERMPRCRRPALWMTATLLLRLAAAAAVFLALGRFGGWVALAGGLAGFVLARRALVRRIARGGDREASG